MTAIWEILPWEILPLMIISSFVIIIPLLFLFRVLRAEVLRAREDTSETRIQEGTSTPASGKVKIVALFAAAPSAIFLCNWLYGVARRLGLLPGTSLRPADGGGWAGWAFASVFFLAIFVVIPLYFPFKVWRRPTLKNLRRLPWVAACWGSFGGIFISRLLPRHGDYAAELQFFPLIFVLVTYFVVKKVLVWWLESPELEDSGLSINTKRGLWGFYCFYLWVVFPHLAMEEALEPYYVELIWLDILVPIALAVICYYVGKRALNLNQG